MHLLISSIVLSDSSLKSNAAWNIGLVTKIMRILSSCMQEKRTAVQWRYVGAQHGASANLGRARHRGH